MPRGVYVRTPERLAAIIAQITTPESKFKATMARKANRPRRKGYASTGKHGEPLKLVHRVRAEKALGRPLPPSAEVHHADSSKSADAPLVICQDKSYHRLLHNRMRIKAAGGDPNTQKLCSRCKSLLPRSEFNKNNTDTVDGLDFFCRGCIKEKNAIQCARRASLASRPQIVDTERANP